MKRTYFFWILALLPLVITAQTAPQPVPGDFAVRPLEELMVDALAFSPALKSQAINIENAYLKTKLLNKEWSNYLSALGSFQVGNMQFLDQLQTEGPNGQPGIQNLTITRENLFYGVGAQVRIPLSDFVTKNDRREIALNLLEQEKHNMQDRQLRIRELVIRQYQALQLAVEVVEIKAKEADFHAITADLAEEYFRQGDMPLNEYTTAVSGRHRAEEALAQAKAEATLSFMVLREIVGTEIGKY